MTVLLAFTHKFNHEAVAKQEYYLANAEYRAALDVYDGSSPVRVAALRAASDRRSAALDAWIASWAS